MKHYESLRSPQDPRRCDLEIRAKDQHVRANTGVGFTETSHTAAIADTPIRREAVGLPCSKSFDRERQQQVLRATGIRDSVRILLRRKINGLARKLVQTHDPNVREELRQLIKEYSELEETGNKVRTSDVSHCTFSRPS